MEAMWAEAATAVVTAMVVVSAAMAFPAVMVVTSSHCAMVHALHGQQ